MLHARRRGRRRTRRGFACPLAGGGVVIEWDGAGPRYAPRTSTPPRCPGRPRGGHVDGALPCGGSASCRSAGRRRGSSDRDHVRRRAPCHPFGCRQAAGARCRTMAPPAGVRPFRMCEFNPSVARDRRGSPPCPPPPSLVSGPESPARDALAPQPRLLAWSRNTRPSGRSCDRG